MRILVTGAQGYIGVQLVRSLTERGHEVVGLDAGFYRDGWLGDGVETSPAYLHKDVRHVTETDLQGFDGVVHLAELSNDPLGELNPKVTYKINYEGSVDFARKCKQAGIPRFVYSSSCSVYGVGSGEYMTEDSPPNPQTEYARCKVLVERAVSGLAAHDFSPVFLRNATAYGPSPRMRFDLVVNNLAGLAWTSGEIRMTSDGTPYRPLVHVLDICEAMACALEAPREAVHNQVLNVGDTRENYQIRDIAGIISSAFPRCRVVFGPSGGDNRSYRVSFEKIRSGLPEFRCRRDAAAGAGELRDLFEDVGLTSELFEFRAFTRVAQLKYLLEARQLDENLFWRPSAEGAGASRL